MQNISKTILKLSKDNFKTNLHWFGTNLIG